MTSIEIKYVEVHPYPEKNMMLVTAIVETDGINKSTRTYYVPCLEV